MCNVWGRVHLLRIVQGMTAFILRIVSPMYLINDPRNPRPRGERPSIHSLPHGSSTTFSYVRELENRLAQVERLIREVSSDASRLCEYVDGIPNSYPTPRVKAQSPSESLGKQRTNKVQLPAPPWSMFTSPLRLPVFLESMPWVRFPKLTNMKTTVLWLCTALRKVS